MGLPSLGPLLRPLRRFVRIARTARRTVAAVPDLVDAVLVLPEISRQLEVIQFQTATLPEMYDEIARLRGDVERVATWVPERRGRRYAAAVTQASPSGSRSPDRGGTANAGAARASRSARRW